MKRRRSSPLPAFYLPSSPSAQSPPPPTPTPTPPLPPVASNPSLGPPPPAMPPKRKRDIVDLDAFHTQLSALARSERSPEVAVLTLMREYKVDLDLVRELLRSDGYDLSFSTVTWKQMAPFIGCSTIDDLGSFEVKRAGIPLDLFQAICGDVQCVALQYGGHNELTNEEARSRMLSSLFTRTVAMFDHLIQNSPETMIEGRFSSRGRIEYYFKTFGGLTIVFIEVKTSISNPNDRQKALAQVIAECDGCDNENNKLSFSCVIQGILTDGENFEFFQYDPTNPSTTPTLSLGYASAAPTKMFLPSGPGLNATSSIKFIIELRCIVESIFWVLINGYEVGLRAYLDRSLRLAKEQGRGRESTAKWLHAVTLVAEALGMFLASTDEALQGKKGPADELAKKGIEKLKQSLKEAPEKYHKQVNFMDIAWDDYVATFET